MGLENKTLRYLVVLLQRLGGRVHVSSQDLEDSKHLNAVEIIQTQGDGADLELTNLHTGMIRDS